MDVEFYGCKKMKKHLRFKVKTGSDRKAKQVFLEIS